MDPNANLDEQREIVQQFIEAIDAVPDDHSPIDGDTPEGERVRDLLVENLSRLLELHQALDEWIVKGGFLPDRWKWTGPAKARATQLADRERNSLKFVRELAALDPGAELVADSVVGRARTIVTTVSDAERKEAQQALVYEKALKFVRFIAGSHYLLSTQVNEATNWIDRARSINREAEEAWR
jgi:hypothetical protein